MKLIFYQLQILQSSQKTLKSLNLYGHDGPEYNLFPDTPQTICNVSSNNLLRHNNRDIINSSKAKCLQQVQKLKKTFVSKKETRCEKKRVLSSRKRK